MVFIYHLTFLEVRSPAHVVQRDPLLRDSQGQNQAMGRAVLLTGPWREYMLPRSFRLLAESSSCIYQTEVSFSLLVVWSLLLEVSLWPLQMGASSRSHSAMLKPSHAWNFFLNIFCYFPLTLTRASSLLGAQDIRLGPCRQSRSIALIISVK